MYLPTLRRRFAVHMKYAKNVTPNSQNKSIEAAKENQTWALSRIMMKYSV